MTRLALLFLLAVLAVLPAGAQTACASRLFVSGYFSTVHVYDACTGAYLQDLDSRTRIQGAMAVRRGPDGFLYVVSEETSQVLKYRNDTLAFVSEFAATGPIGPTGMVFDAAGKVYVAGYRSQDVKRFSATGALEASVFAPRSGGLGGPDNGLSFGPDGNLYVPGYDTHNVVKWDPRTGIASEALAPRSGGIRNTRGLLPTKDGTGFFVTAEGSGQLLRWNLATGELVAVRSGLSRPTGIDYAPDGNLLVVDGESVVKIDPATGTTLTTLVAPGRVSGPVFVAVIAKATSTVDASQVGSQFWVVGDAAFAGRVLDIATAYTASGTAFGADLKFSELAIKRWGTIRFELLTCTTARFSYDSTGANSAGFGAGGYDLVRFFEDEGTQRCRERGVDHADKSWVNGQWWGGQSRAGEGIFVDRRADGTAFLAWFTHRPR
jgi:streptogramin lyase